MNYEFSKRSKLVLSKVHPDLQKVFNEAISMSDIDFGIPSSGGLRTAEEQRALFNEGKSKCDGYQRKSYHQSGNAVDVYAYVDGAASWDPYHLEQVADVIKAAANIHNIDITWGGDWKGFIDMPHFQLKK